MATQNPVEQEGTYPLPEAQLDRFKFNLFVDYPTPDEEQQIVRSTTSPYKPELRVVMDKTRIMDYQNLVRHRARVGYRDRFSLVTKTRSLVGSEKMVKNFITWGAGPERRSI